ncbi:hypothetical protein, partial [Pseudomonas corrugata]|uniref:hypothetical protein n=1 Tax=Pseudomonas corrugata TaxID=47879 RepID=UPI0019D7087B
ALSFIASKLGSHRVTLSAAPTLDQVDVNVKVIDSHLLQVYVNVKVRALPSLSTPDKKAKGVP